MALRCFLFSSDEGTAAIIGEILSALDVEAEFCSNAVKAVERITNQPFQIVIIDWDQQPEAGLLLNTARERKAAERPITLAIVSDDASAPQALHAGANSLLRKPLVVHQARETLTTARDLIRAKQGSATQAAAAGASGASIPASLDPGHAKTLRAGDFLQTPPLAPGGHFVTEEPATSSPAETPGELVDPLEDLEPTAASVSSEGSAPAQPGPPGGSRGLQWYLKTRLASQPAEFAPPPASAVTAAQAPAAPVPAPATRGNPELLGYDQAASYSPPPPAPLIPVPRLPRPAATPPPPSVTERRQAAELFAYIQEGSDPSPEPSSSRSGLMKRAIMGAVVLAAFAIIAAPQAPWHPKLKGLWLNGKHSIHAWLYPQPVTSAAAPASHESFTRAGDEYKLPVAEAIPDATTDPSQITVVPVVDPTLRKPNSNVPPPDPTAIPVPADGSTLPTGAPGQSPASQTPESHENQASPITVIPEPSVTQSAVPATSPAAPLVASAPVHRDIFVPSTSSASNPVAPRPARSQPVFITGKVPSSLKSQLTTMAPATGGNKPVEAALPSIEPVSISEIQARALLTEDPPPAYPANAKGQQGTVTLEILVGRDGAVQDAKFIQGSLVFARAATDSVRLWKFKPYTMNGRPVSVQSLLTIKFKPAQ
jgi:TonB family protein